MFYNPGMHEQPDRRKMKLCLGIRISMYPEIYNHIDTCIKAGLRLYRDTGASLVTNKSILHTQLYVYTNYRTPRSGHDLCMARTQRMYCTGRPSYLYYIAEPIL